MRSVRSAVFLGVVLSVGCESSPDRPPPVFSDGGVRVDAGILADGGGDDDGATVDSGEVDSGMIAVDSGVDGGAPDGGAQISIPDPGTAMDDWGFNVNNVCCSTPDTAYPTGIVTMNSGYVQGNIDAISGDFFYVFRAGPALTTLTWTGFLPIDLLDLHDGANMVFGPVIAPTSTGQNMATWPMMPNHVYVLHLHSTSSGFF